MKPVAYCGGIHHHNGKYFFCNVDLILPLFAISIETLHR